MFIVMHCMGIPFNGDTIKSQSLGGSETSAYYMAKELVAKGHEVKLFTNSQAQGMFDGVEYVFAGQATEQHPLGELFHHYTANTPHDVLIIQRHPHAFKFNWAAKVKLWWVHDLAQHTMAPEVQGTLWNMDGILTVSEFHKQQYAEVYGINPDIIYPIQNGVDLSLFEGSVDMSPFVAKGDTPHDQFRLLYTSRPERGLAHLVKEGGIMEKLADKVPDAHLYVCGYDNTTAQMKPYYDHLWQRCEELPNVTNLGSLTKQELADVMRQVDLHVYPTPGPLQPNFEEVSCITAMEAMAAGLPFLSSSKGALNETCKDSGSMLLSLNDDGMPDIDEFVGAITAMYYNPDELKVASEAQLTAAKKYDWSVAAEMLEGHIKTCFEKNRSPGAIARHLMEQSDIYALREYLRENRETVVESPIMLAVEQEMLDCYGFAFEDNWAEHYANYYQYEKERGVNYGPEDLSGNSRFESVSSIIGGPPDGSVVLDYGCAHGHYTVNLAKRYPGKTFIGVDITQSNIDKAKAWAEEEGVKNTIFICGSFEDPDFSLDECLAGNFESDWMVSDGFDAIIAAEVIEHVGKPQEYVDLLRDHLADDGKMIITVPYGPWEAMGYKEHWPWRAHVWHFERQDLQDMWGHMDNFQILVAPSGRSKFGSNLGSHIVLFDKTPGVSSGIIDMRRKFEETVPRQTVSLCMIVKDAEATLKKALDSVADQVDEIILAVDNTTTDDTMEVINKFRSDRVARLWPLVRVIDIESPLKTGFAEARNTCIAEADGDWIFWMDSDEVMVNPDNLWKYFHNNQYRGYAVKQHHFSVEPLGVMKTDLPCRFFRNHHGIKFFGLVHEHPETELNKGVGYVQLVHDIEIAHHGYTTEDIRRRRFDRNIGLMMRDRKENPDRYLGKFLWIRDLAQMIRYDMEFTNGHVTQQMIEMAKEGIKLWEELLDDGQTRMLVEGMEFYSMLVQVLGIGFEAGVMLETSKGNGGVHLERAQPIQAHFASREHLDKLMTKLLDDKTRGYDSRYF